MAVTIKQIETALTQAKGNISGAARALDVTRSAVHNRIEKSPELKELLHDLREARLDVAEDKLGDAVTGGEAWAVCFTLKTQGKGRGYVEKQEIDHGGTVNVTGEIAVKIDQIYGRD